MDVKLVPTPREETVRPGESRLMGHEDHRKRERQESRSMAGGDRWLAGPYENRQVLLQTTRLAQPFMASACKRPWQSFTENNAQGPLLAETMSIAIQFKIHHE